jgi:hypothetical protein
MADPKPLLRCDTCRARPNELEAKYSAKLGGTHYKRLTHGAGIPGREQGGKFRTCGKWVEDKEERDG